VVLPLVHPHGPRVLIAEVDDARHAQVSQGLHVAEGRERSSAHDQGACEEGMEGGRKGGGCKIKMKSTVSRGIPPPSLLVPPSLLPVPTYYQSPSNSCSTDSKW